MSESPYSGLPASSFWRSAVAERHPTELQDLYAPRFRITATSNIATAGSCFAQHITRHFTKWGYQLLDVEPRPAGMSDENAQRYGFGLFSARYGNIYLTRQLLQLAREAFGEWQPQDAVWERDGRYYDALRPSVEPDGLASADEVIAHRQAHLQRVRELLQRVDLFVFTFGLTEGWLHSSSGTVYPTAPGTIAGSFDAGKYSFKNFTHAEIRSDFLEFRERIRSHNPNARFLLTVSPVPLTATAAARHVLLASTYSKSVLRAVAGELYDEFSDIDYFPSYEIISSPWSRGFFFGPNLRTVSDLGVRTAMNVFAAAHGAAGKRPAGAARKRRRLARPETDVKRQDPVCEEVLLDAFKP